MAYRIILGLLLAVSLAACNDDGSSTSNSSSSPNATPAATTDKPVISGMAPATAVVGQTYSFQPTRQ